MSTADKNAGQGGPVRIAAICGSMAPRCRTRAALECALRGATEPGVETRFIGLHDYELVILGQVPQADYPADVARLRDDVAAADGFIIGTPEYYGAPTGALKNALDLIGAEAFKGKITGLVGVAGGNTGAVNSLNVMRIIGRNLHNWVLPQEVSVANASASIGEDGTILDASLEQRLLELGGHVARFTLMQRRIREDAFFRLWEDLPRW